MTKNELVFEAAILCGGKSRRMGRDKARLPLQSSDFTGILAGELASFGKVYLSCGEEWREEYAAYGMEQVCDMEKGCGPAAGIHAVLTKAEKSGADAVLFVPCDVPLFTQGAASLLCEKLGPGIDGVILRDAAGQLHPLTAVYRCSCASVFGEELGAGNRRVLSIIEKLSVAVVDAFEIPGGDKILANINTPEEYDSLVSALRSCPE